jgi:hypothetical protein
MLLIFSLGAFTDAAHAEESDWHTSWDGMVYGYAGNTKLRSDSVLNPGNQVARLAQNSDSLDARFNFKAENEVVRFTARPIVVLNDSRNNFGAQQKNEAYLSLWQVRLSAAESVNVAAGREVLNWGAAQFRSPSSPFYFNNGRSNPMRELSGVDDVKISWTPDTQRTLTVARVLDSGYAATANDVWRNSSLVKFDQRGEARAVGMVAVKTPNLPTFLGAHGQTTISDALMLYGEIGSSAQPLVLQSPADMTLPFSVQTPSARHTTSLFGTSYTFDSGNALNVEYLHDSRGYNVVQEAAYFQRAVVQPGMALSLAPPLLGRDYVNLVWQSNLMESGGYQRAMWTHSLSDIGNQLTAYAETTLMPKLSAFALGMWNIGNARQEFSALFKSTITLGLKVALQ